MTDFSKLSILSSNEKKIREYNNFGLKVKAEKGIDLPEIDSNIDDIIIYKSLHAGSNKIVEDTILEVDGVEIIDIRWRVKQMNIDASAKWIVSLGLNDGEYIKIYRGIVKGKIVKTENINDSDFDQYFIPDGSELRLLDLDKVGLKNNFSARKLACENLVSDNHIIKIKIDNISQWTGNYQKK